MPGSTVRTSWRRLAAPCVGIALGGVALAADVPPIATPPTAPAVPSIAAPPPPQAAPLRAAAAPSPAPAAPQPDARPNLARLEQLVAPIALYPDPLLAQILMASTYPLEVVEAARWTADPAHRALAGEALTAALAMQPWDPSVRALVAFPEVLANMSQQLQWTQDLGNAVLAGQHDVMDAVQHLRRAAMAAGHLATTPQCDCTVQAGPAGGVSIPAAEPEQIRVPVYGPEVYGSWPDADYPPDTFPVPDGVDFPPGSGLGFESPVDLALFGPLWGWSWIDWRSRVIVVGQRRLAVAVAAGRRAASAGRVWVHDPAHRGGVRYADAATRSRFEAARIAALTSAAMRTRTDGVRVVATAAPAMTAAPARFDGAESVAAGQRGAASGGGVGPAAPTVIRGRTALDREGTPHRAPRAARREAGGTGFRAAPVPRAPPASHGGLKIAAGSSHSGGGPRTGGTSGQAR